MTKKLMILVVLSGLMFCFGISTLAEDKTVYFEYSKEEGKDDYYPKVGLIGGLTIIGDLLPTTNLRLAETVKQKPIWKSGVYLLTSNLL